MNPLMHADAWMDELVASAESRWRSSAKLPVEVPPETWVGDVRRVSKPCCRTLIGGRCGGGGADTRSTADCMAAAQRA